MEVSETASSAGVRPAYTDSQAMRVAIGYYLAFIALGLTSASLGPTLTALAENTQSALWQVSYLFTARSLGYLSGSFLGGHLYDRLPGNPVIAAMLMVMVAGLVAVPGIQVLGLLILVLYLIGVVEGASDVGGNALLVWLYRERVGPYMNALHFFFGVGAFLSPLIIAQAIRFSGEVRWGYWLLALLILPIPAWLLRQPSPKAQPAEVNTPAGRSPMGLVALVAAFLFIFVAAEVSFGGWIATYAVAADLTVEMGAYLTSAFWGALTLGRLLSIPLATRWRPRTLLLVDVMGCLLSVGLLLIWPKSPIVLWIGSCGLGLSMASVFPTAISLAERHMRVTGQITGWFLVGASVGGMTLPLLIGQLFERVGPLAVLVAIFVDLVVAVGIFVALMVGFSRSAQGREARLGLKQ